MRGQARVLPLLLALALAFAGAALTAQPATIEEIQVYGLFRMNREAFLHALGVRAGEEYDVGRLRARFKAVWKLGLFDDLTFEAEPTAAGGMLVVVKVKERPVLTAVTYEDTKAVTRTEIEDRLRERGSRLELGKPLDTRRVYLAEALIRDLLGEKGYLDAEVSTEVRTVTETSKALHFAISTGGKTRILEIDFTGNEVFGDGKLRKQLKLTQERKWYWPWSRKNLYHPGKWDQDVAAVRELYQNHGYLDVDIRPPVVEVRRKPAKAPAAEPPPPEPPGPAAEPAEPLTPKAARKAEKRRAKERRRQEGKSKPRVHLTVPVREGGQYRLGELTVAGNEKFKDETLRALVPLREGAVLENNRLELGVNRITRLYEDLGHLYASVVRRIERREGELVADVEVLIDEDEPYYVATIDFLGNSATQDRVLRREVALSEGELFSRTKLDLSRAKINQLGYFQIEDEPTIEPVEGENRVRIRFQGTEQNRNEIQIGGGYSGLDGAFFSGVYSTRNFLGRGQILSTNLQVGGRSNRYQISFQEPWFLGRPYRFGLSVFRRDIDYGSSLRSASTGGGIVIGKRFGRGFAQGTLGYNYENVESRTTLFSTTGTDTISITDEQTVSSLTPSFVHDTINNPYRPTRGRSFGASMQIAGGPLGGDTAFLKPIASFTGYRRAFGRAYFALHAQLGLVREWQGGSEATASSNIEGIPRYQRFWLGGDTLGPRVFETRSITPLRYVRLEDGRIVEVLGDPRFLSPDDFVASGGIPVPVEVGGDRFYLWQSELVYPLNEQAEVALFLDAGDALYEDQSWGFETARVSAGVELRFYLPVFPVPLRLIYGVPVRKIEGDDTSSFTFSIGRSF